MTEFLIAYKQELLSIGRFITLPFLVFIVKEFKIPVKELWNLSSTNKELYLKLREEINKTNEEFNDIREILYEYVLSKIANIQKIEQEK